MRACVRHTIFDVYIEFQRSMSAVKVCPSFLCDKSVRCNATQKCKDISGVFNSTVESSHFYRLIWFSSCRKFLWGKYTHVRSRKTTVTL